MRLLHLALPAAIAILVGCSSAPTDRMAPGAAPASQLVPASALNADIRQDNILQTICLSGWTATVRPTTAFTRGVKARLLQGQGTSLSEASFYELDHRIPLALGGHPTNGSNLTLQALNVAKRKDQLERKLQVMVCSGKVSLETARERIYVDWPAAYRDLIERQ